MSGEDSETMARLLFANSPFRNELHQESGFEMPSMHWNEKEANSTRCFPCDVNSNLSYWYQSGTTSSHFVHSSDIESYYLTDPNAVPTSNALVDFGIVEDKNNQDTNNCDHDETFQKSVNPKKRAKAPTNVQKNGKMNTKKSQKSIKMEATETKIGGSSGVCSSEDESSASQEMEASQLCSETKVTTTKTTKSKPRAARGSTSDPQSLYARKRRERINERLRILQGLVPNGTKVDISTMLEEAVQYVKFLQLQIKLLSSDDLWMYSPIAYNGMDIGLDLKISLP